MVLLMLALSSCAAEPEATSTTALTTTTPSTTTTTEATTTTVATTTATTIPVPTGYSLIEIEGEKIRLALPESWVTLDLTQEGWEELLTASLEALPDVAALVGNEAQAIIREGGLLLAYDLQGDEGDFATNLNILESERGPFDDPDVVFPALGEQLELFGAVEPAIDRVEVPLGQAIKASYGFAPETGFTHEVVQYYVFAEGSLYIVTLSTANLVDLEFVFETIMSTFDSTD
jgi:hypothetical protein